MADGLKSVRRVVSFHLLMVVAALMAVIGVSARGAVVDSQTASLFVSNWLASVQGELSGCSAVEEPEVVKQSDGTVLAYVFNLSPKGYVVVSGDNRLAPVIAVGVQGRFEIDPKSPAYAFLFSNLSGRLKYLSEKVSETRGGDVPAGVEENMSEWAEYASGTRANMKTVVSEIWVDSFVKSTWSQGDCIYNYYTPTIYDTTYTFANAGSEENLVCGCVATGTAQIMRYFQWPQKKIGSKMGSCTIVYRDPDQLDEDHQTETISMKLRGGNGAGGAYNWDLMALNPGTGSISDEARQQIGALCLDAGLSVGMTYNLKNGNESGANYNAETLMSLFGYANARSLNSEEECRANLDARRPVAVSIAKPSGSGSHAIVCDGYGRMGGRWYYHMNMGWSGSYDGWYNFDENYNCGDIYTGCSFDIGNVFRQPLQQGEALTGGQILSGRIVDANGNPVQGVRVALKKQGQVEDVEFLTMLAWYDPIDPQLSITADWDEVGNKDGAYDPEERPGAEKFRNCTDANGIWAIDKIAAGNYYVVLSKDGLEFRGDTTVSISKTNIWGKDFIAVPKGDATANLELKNWYCDGSNMLWLEFNRELGNAQVDLSRITVNGKTVGDAILYQAADSKYIALDCDGLLSGLDGNSTLSIGVEAITMPTITDNATVSSTSGGSSGSSSSLSISISGSDDESDANGNLVNITVPVTDKKIAGTDGISSTVTAIVRAPRTKFDVSARTLTFVVVGGAGASLNDFKVSSAKSWGTYKAKSATEPPVVTLDSFDGTNLKVTVGQGDGYVRVDYIPADGAPFLTGETYHVDNIGPAIVRADLSYDNKYVDVTWNENVVRNESATGSFAGRKATQDDAVYAYDGDINLGTNFALWICGADRSKVGNGYYNVGDVALKGSVHPDTGAAYTGILSDMTTSIYGFTFTLGRYYYIDTDGDDHYDEGEGVFLNLISNIDELKEDPLGFSPKFDDCYDPNREGNYDVAFWCFGAMPPGKTDAKVLAKSQGAKVYYYNKEKSGPAFTGADIEKLKEDYSDWFTATSFWLDYQPATRHAYNPTLDTLILSKGQNEKTTNYEEVTDEICYLDLDGAGCMTSSSFIWFDADGDGCYDTSKSSMPRDVVLSDDANSLVYKGINEDDLDVILHANGGTVVDVKVYAVTSTDVTERPDEDEIEDNRLPYGVKKFRVWLAYTPELEQNVEYSTETSAEELSNLTAAQRQSSNVPAGVETIEIRPAVDAVFDTLGNVSPTSNTTDELLLYDTSQPRVVSASVRYDNLGVQLLFNKRIYGNSGGLDGNYVAASMKGLYEEYEVLDVGNFNVYVVLADADGNEATRVKLEMPKTGEFSTSRSVEYTLGKNYCELNLFTADNAHALLNAQDGLYSSIDTITKTTTWSSGSKEFVTEALRTTTGVANTKVALDKNGNAVETRLYDETDSSRVIQYTWNNGSSIEKIEYENSKPVTYRDGNGNILLQVVYNSNGKITDYQDASGTSVAKKDGNGDIELDSNGNAQLGSGAYVPHVGYTYTSAKGNVGAYTYQEPSDGATCLTPQKLVIEFMEIYDLYGTKLAQESLEVDLHPAYTRGLKEPTLPPPMFTTGAEPAYTQVWLRGDFSAINKEPNYTYNLSNTVRGLPWITAPTDSTNGVVYSSSVRMANVIDPGSENKLQWEGIFTEENEDTGDSVTYYGVQRVQYGVFYRDLDGDGRVDAVDLNFKNPYREWHSKDVSYSASLVVNNLGGFKVWVQKNDPNDIDNETKKLYPPEKEIPGTESKDPTDPTKTVTSNGWEDMFGKIVPNYGATMVDYGQQDPMNTVDSYNRMKTFNDDTKHYFSANWEAVAITGYELKPSEHKEYTTLRLKLQQSAIPPRTYGDRWIMVAYQAPKYSLKSTEIYTYIPENTYNWGVKGSETPAKKPEATTMPTYYNNLVDAQLNYYNNSDEASGIYWTVTSSSRTNITEAARYSFVPAYFIVDTFGPVIAWDGAEPVPVAATTWRAQTYPEGSKSSPQSDKYEYVDVSFSEPIAYALDKPSSGFGYGSGQTPSGILYGAWGAELLDETTVRFKRTTTSTSRAFSYNGKMAPRNGGYSVYRDSHIYSLENGYTSIYKYELASSDKQAVPVKKNFSLTAVGILPDATARYRVLAHDQNESLVDMFTVNAEDIGITNNTQYDTTEFNDTNTYTFALKYTSAVLNAYSQGGGWTGNTALWYRNGTRLGTTGTARTDSVANTGQYTYSLLSNASEVTPGAGMYGGITKVTLTNTTIAGMSGSGLDYMTEYSTAFDAPAPMGRFNGFSSALTPRKAILAGPVYDMVKAGATQIASGTARIQAGKTYDVIGIDCAGNSNNKLESVRVRFVDTSYGQFDPVIDLEPVADTKESGVQLVDADKNVIKISTDSMEWSGWGRTDAGLPYREVTLRLLAMQEIPTTGGNANSFDFYIRIKTSENFNLGDNFYVEIPDDGISFNTGSTKDGIAESWNIVNGTKGFPFNDCMYYDKNSDGRWDEGESITNAEDSVCPTPIYDGGYPYFPKNVNAYLLNKSGITVRDLFYAKEEWATNPESYPFTSYANATVNDPAGLGDMLSGTKGDYEYNVSYAPGDAVWYEIGGTYGVYDEGIDLPLFGNADKFILPWQVSESGTRSGQLRAAAPVTTHSAENKYISAPSNEPVAVVGLNMQDAGRGFGPRYILEESILVETISKNVPGATYTLSYKSGTMAWKEVNEASYSAYSKLPTAKNERAVIEGKNGMFIVVRNLTGSLPSADSEIPFIVSKDIDRDIQQPTAIKGVRIHAVGRGNAANAQGTLTRSGTTLAWNGGTAVDVTDSGVYTLNADRDDYIVVEVTSIGGATTESLNVYEADGRSITPFLNISGVEIMAVSDMTPMGYYNFSYDGTGNLSWGSGAPVSVKGKAGDLFVLNGDSGVNNDYARSFVIVRRTSDALSADAVTERLFINQTQLLKVNVTLKNVLGVTSTHFAPLSNDETSGISLWWDANADGKFNSSDMFVKLLEAPVLKGSGDSYTCTLTPDPSFLTAWLSCPQDVSTSVTGSNFFVCVKTTVDMSYGDIFSVTAAFYEPTEADDGGKCFATQGSGNITCSSITNTVIKKLTTAGQTVDANTCVKLFSIDHFLGTKDYSEEVYITAVTVTMRGLSGVSAFDPETALTAMDDETPSKRGIVLYKYGKNGEKDSLIECYIDVTHDESSNEWTYKLLPVATGGDSNVPSQDDGSADHYVAINMSEILPYGISFNGTMSSVAVEYKTGVGSAGASVTTDTLTSTIATQYVDLLGSRMVTSMSGLVVNGFGSNVENGYHNISISYTPGTDTYTLTWGNSTVELDITQKAQYTLGDGEDYITVTFDPEAFFREDTPVNGLPPAEIKQGDKLVNVIKDASLTYHDANGDGSYTQGELIAREGELVYNGTDNAMTAEAVSSFTYADHLAFFDANGDGILNPGEIIFRDTDEQYLLPWMDFLVDNDNYVTAGKGGASSITVGDKLVDAATVSIAAGVKAPNAGLYLYYVDVVDDGRGYDYKTDVLVARALLAKAVNPELVFGKGIDKVVLDPLYGQLTEDGQEMATAVEGKAMRQLATMDYLRFRQQGADDAAMATYEQGKALFFSLDNEYSLPDFTWTIRIDSERTIRRYEANAPTPFNRPVDKDDVGHPTNDYALSAIIGLDIANGGATDVKLTSVKVRFNSVRGFTTSDLRPLSTDITSGVQLWRDMDGNGSFDADIDKMLPLGGTPAWTSDTTDNYLVLSPASGNEISNESVDNVYDFFIVVQADPTANSLQKYNYGDKCDQFKAYINVDDVILNKTRNKTAQISKSQAKVISIDSMPPQLLVKAMYDEDGDGFIETIILTFDEKLRPGMLSDLDIWKILDLETNQEVPVAAAELSEDYLTVTLTLDPFAFNTTTSPMMLKVEYNSQNALMDWTGNPVDMRLVNGDYDCEVTDDTVVPRVLHSGVKFAEATELYDADYIVAVTGLYFRDRNGNDAWDDGEDIWLGSDKYASASQRVWNGGNAWTTPVLYAFGKELKGVYASDANRDGEWERGEFIWIDVDADGLYDEEGDVQIPQNRTEEIEALDYDGNGFVDTVKVTFSEYVKDETMEGYMADKDSYAPTCWSIEGYTGLLALRALDDTTNDNVIYFRFDEAALADTGALPKLMLLSGESLEDMYGNELENGMGINDLVVTDHAKPVLTSVVSNDRVTDENKLVAGTAIVLTFSEPLVNFAGDDADVETLLKAFTLASGTTVIPFSSDNATVEVNDNRVTITIVKDIENLPTNGYELTVRELADGALADAAGNCLHAVTGFEVPSLNSADQLTFVSPVESQYIRNDSDALAVKIHFGDYDPAKNDITEWKLQLVADGEELAALEGTDKAGLAAFAEDEATTDFENWAIAQTYGYSLCLTMTVSGRERVFTCPFFYSKNDDVYDAGEGVYVYDGATQGVDADQILMSDGALSVNWIDFAKASSLPAADHYVVTFYRDGEVFCNSDSVSECQYTRSNLILTIHATYKAVVEAYDKSNVKLAVASSNGAVAVNVISDTKAPVVTFVNDGLGADIDVTASTSELSANWAAQDDISSPSALEYSYRIARDFATADWQLDNSGMSYVRSDFGYATLNDKVYVVGGCGQSGNALGSVESYSATTRKWTLEPQSLKTARYSFAFAQLSDSEMLVAGGFDNDGAVLDTIEYFDGSTWTELADVLPVRLSGAQAMAVDGQHVWFVGGYDDSGLTRNIYELDLDTGLVNDVPVAAMSLNRTDFTMTLQRTAKGNALVIAGGRDENNVATDAVDVVYVRDYSVVQRRLTHARDYHAAVAVPNGADTMDEVWFIGGYDNTYNSLASVEALDANSVVKDMADLKVARAELSALWLPEAARVLVAGGKMTDEATADATSTECADSTGNAWTDCSDIALTAGRSGSKMALAGERVVLFGGMTQAGAYTVATESRLQVDVLTDWSDWKAGTTSVTVKNLALDNGQRYIFEVKARDEGGNVSSVVASNGVRVDVNTISATMTCSTWPETDGGSTLNQDFTVTVGGANVTHYSYSLNGAAYSQWIAVGTPINLDDCADGGYTLNVCGKDSSSGATQAESGASSRSWTVEAPVVVIESGLPAEGTSTLDYNPTIVISGNGVTSYSYELFKAAVGSTAWSSQETGSDKPIAQALTFTNLEKNKQYKLAVTGKYQQRVSEAVTRTWTVAESGLEPVFNPALPDVAAVKEYTFTVRDKSGLGAIDKFKYIVKDSQGTIVAGSEETEYAMNASVTLDLDAGSYELCLKAHSISLGDWLPDYEKTALELAVVTFDAASFGPSTQDSYTLNVNLNGLKSYNYQLDDGSVVSSEASTLNVGPLSAGTHIVKAWGKDSAGQEQAEATELAIYVNGVMPVGETFTATIAPAVAEQAYTDAAENVKDVEYTVSFNDKLMAALAKSDLTATNGTVKSVAAAGASSYEYKVLVTPNAVTSGNLVTLAIAANKVYSWTTGNGNTAASASTLVYATKMLSFEVIPVTAGTETPIDHAVKGESFDVQVFAESQEGFMGGELYVKYDSEYFQCTLPCKDGSADIDPEKVLSTDYRAGAFAEYVYDDASKVIGVRIGGSRGAAPQADRNLFATLSFKAIKESSTAEKAIATEAVPTATGFVFWNIRNYKLPVDSDAVDYGTVELTIDPEPAAEVTIAADKQTINEGEAYRISVNLNTAFESDVTVTLTDGTATEQQLTISAGDESASLLPITTVHDHVINGNTSVTWSIIAVTPADNVTIGSPSSVTVTILDKDLIDMKENLTLTAVSESGAAVSSVTEGDSFSFKVQLPVNVTTSSLMTFAASWSGTAQSADYYVTSTLQIDAGQSSGSIKVDTSENLVAANDKTIVLALTSTTIDSVTYTLTGVSSIVGIEDDDRAITFSATADSVNEGESFSMTAALADGIVAEEDISFAMTVGGTAQANVDYKPLAAVLAIKAGETSGTVTLETIVNEEDLSDKTFSMVLNSMTIGKGNALALSDKSVNVTIKNAVARKGDFDGNGTVDFDDLVELLPEITGQSATGKEYMDLDGDGDIDFDDLIEFLALMDSDTRGGFGEDTRAGETITMILEADKDELEVGDEFTLTLKCRANFTTYPIAAVKSDVLFNVANLSFQGDSVTDCVNSTAFGLAQNGTLSEAGISQLGGAANTNSKLGLDGEDVIVATIPMKLTSATESSVTISLGNFNGSTYGAGGKSGLKVSNGTLTMTGDALVIPVKGVTPARDFAMALDVTPASTRGTAELAFGMKDGASDAYSSEDGDTLWTEGFAGAYSVYIELEGRDELLKKDFRGISDNAVWKVMYKVPEAQAPLSISWDAYITGSEGYAMPSSYYDIVLTDSEGNEIDMRAATANSIQVSGNGSFQIAVSKHIDYKTVSYSLKAGWNLVGVTMDLAEGEFEKFEGCTVVGFNEATQAFNATVTEMAAGKAYWVKSDAEKVIELKGTTPENTAVALVAGWNLVSPKAVEAWSYVNPAAIYGGIADAWTWSDGKLVCLAEDAAIAEGTGLWLYSSKAQTIWDGASAAEPPQASFDESKNEYFVAIDLDCGYALTFGMHSNATKAFSMDEFDSPLPPLPTGCTADATLATTDATAVPALSAGLVTDIRGVTDDASTWTVSYNIQAGKQMKLDWSQAVLPAYYDVSLSVDGAEEIDMKGVITSLTLNGGAKGLAGFITVTSRKTIEKQTMTYTLAAGWNIVGIPFDLDEEEFAKLAGYTIMGYDGATQAYIETVTVNDAKAGTAFWLYANSAATLTLKGVMPETTAVSVVHGWNLVSPHYRATHGFVNPCDYEGIDEAWIWCPSTGYEWLRPQASVSSGQGVWFYSDKAQTIWQ